MSKKEIIILLLIITVLIIINIIGYIKRENLKSNYAVLIEEGTIQVSINEAGADELEELPGVGPVLARRIVEYRHSNGQFEKLDDLKQVKGIGDKLFQSILQYIKL